MVVELADKNNQTGTEKYFHLLQKYIIGERAKRARHYQV